MALNGTFYGTTSNDYIQPKIVWSAEQDVTGNYSMVTAILYYSRTNTGYKTYGSGKFGITINGETKTENKTITIEHNSNTEVIESKVKVLHNADGTKKITISGSGSISGTTLSSTTISSSVTLNTIPRKSSLTASNGTLGTAQILEVTKRATSFTHTITYKCGSASGTICSKSSSTSISWIPALSLASQNTTGTSVSVTLTITTYSGSTNIGSNTKTISCSIPASVKPTLTVAVNDPNGYADMYGAFVRGLSKFKVVVTPTLAYGSAIKSYKTTANGGTYTSASFTTNILNSSGTLNVVSTITDNRGRSNSKTVSIPVLNYNPPTISKLDVHRCEENGALNDRGEYVEVKFSAGVTKLSDDNPNTASYKLRYKASADADYTEAILESLSNEYAVTNYSFIFAADSGSSYDIELSVTDNHNTTYRTTTASTGFTLMHWNAAGNGMGIGKMSEFENVLDIGLETRFDGGILYIALPKEADLNEVRTTGFYIGSNIVDSLYANAPISTGTFTLEVAGAGEEGQLKQTFTYCHKTQSKIYERFYYQETWGDWVCISDFSGTVLWSGALYMNGSQNISLKETISSQKMGITLVFCYYADGAAANEQWVMHFIPKYMIQEHPSGAGYSFNCNTSWVNACKYLYIDDTNIWGNDRNSSDSLTVGGITYTNKKMILRYVIGV